jgi:ribosomal protein L11 methyltransferase
LTGWKIELVVRQSRVEAFSGALDEMAVAIAAFEIVPGGDWRIEAYLTDPPDADAVAAALRNSARSQGVATPEHHIAPLPPVDWLAENRRSFPALGIGRFYIHGSHLPPRPTPGRVQLLLDAATAFGSGEHATTRGCLIAIDRLSRIRKPGRRGLRRPLDVGCGSGVLAIGLAKLTHRPVVASDLDPESVRVATANAHANGVASLVRVVAANGYRSRSIRAGRPYDLIVSNILAKPLCRLALDLKRHLAPGGYVILSGLLNAQETQVLNAHRRHGLALMSRWRSEGWSALILRRRGG